MRPTKGFHLEANSESKRCGRGSRKLPRGASRQGNCLEDYITVLLLFYEFSLPF